MSNFSSPQKITNDDNRTGSHQSSSLAANLTGSIGMAYTSADLVGYKGQFGYFSDLEAGLNIAVSTGKDCLNVIQTSALLYGTRY